MKKSLIALAAVAAVGAASAQSSVTLYGVLDTAYNNLSATNAGTLSRLTGNGSNQASRLGFRGVEDLGGGLKANFVLEAGINVDNGTGAASPTGSTIAGQNLLTGTGNTGNAITANPVSSNGGLQGLTFNRRATVGLQGAFGEVRLGRDLTPSFLNLATFDPFGNVGVGSALNVALGGLNPAGNSVAPPGSPKPQIRSSNSIGYMTPNLGGFTGQVMYAFAEVPTNCTAFGAIAATTNNTNSCTGASGDGKYLGLRGAYANGPIGVAAAYGKTTYANDPTAPAGLVVNGGTPLLSQFRGNYTVMNLGASYDFGKAKAMVQYGTQVQQANINQTLNTGTGALDLTRAAQDQKLTHYLLGVSVPVGAGEFKASYNWGKVNSRALVIDNQRKQTQLALGYVHNLSKRTAAYTTYSRLNASGNGAVATMGLNSSAATAASGVSATGYDIGIRHSF